MKSHLKTIGLVLAALVIAETKPVRTVRAKAAELLG